MKKNEAVNFGKQYKSTICLDSCLKPIKIVDCLERDTEMYCLIQTAEGEKREILFNEPIIPLKGRLKNRDYDLVEAKFYASLNPKI